MLSTNIALPVFDKSHSSTTLATQQVSTAMMKKSSDRRNRKPTIKRPISWQQQAVASAATGRSNRRPKKSRVNKNNQPAAGSDETGSDKMIYLPVMSEYFCG